jgi:AraC-like DNA-binding protein
MKIVVNEEKVNEILKNFYKITGLKITIFSVNFEVLAEYPKYHCSFCSYINSKKNGKKMCEHSNWHALNECKNKKQTFIYKCPFKLIEAAMPLFKNNEIIGYVMAGQIRNTNDKDEILKELENHDKTLTTEKKKDLIDKINYHTPEHLKSALKILEICSMYLVSSGLFEVKDNLHYKMLEYINENALKNFNIENLCNCLNISRTLAYDTFKNSEGIGIIEYVKNVQIKKAIELLKSRQYSIKEIAYEVGFSNSNHFINAFKKQIGITPKQYQIKLKL